ncbi:MAG: CidA/LrgA family protein [Lachnospiraceae bacterium]|nr:CidA/LrgA family protein [Lachnospiraceae bacterium]MDY5742173.1 CidA/LrgA family protein [Lachnospiraceae bacterium]
MKYLYHMMRILAVVLMAEACNRFIPLPVPTSIYGIMILFGALQSGLLKLEQIEETADFLLAIMPILFVPTAIGIMNSYQQFADSIWIVLLILFFSTLVTMGATGAVGQWMLSKRKKKTDEQQEEEA